MSLKQSSKEPVTSKAGALSPCWGRERECECLRVETHEGAVFIFPYQQFVVAHLQRQDDAEVLTISFASHTLRLEGRHLEEVIAALQEYGVDWIAPTPTRYSGLQEGDSAMITKLEITPVE